MVQTGILWTVSHLGDQQWWASLLTPSKCLHVTHSPKLWVRQWRPFSIWFELMGKKWAIFFVPSEVLLLLWYFKHYSVTNPQTKQSSSCTVGCSCLTSLMSFKMREEFKGHRKGKVHNDWQGHAVSPKESLVWQRWYLFLKHCPWD